jgi:hypothetical protein
MISDGGGAGAIAYVIHQTFFLLVELLGTDNSPSELCYPV